MIRNRVIYNVLAVYASQVKPELDQTAAGTIKQLTRVQSFDEDFSRNFTDVNQFGNLAAIDRIETEAPSVNASLSYYVTDGSNEKYLGLNTSGTVSCIADLLQKTKDEKNYYLLIADEGNDANGYSLDNTGVIAIGNGFLTSYSVTAAVGDIPTASVDLEGLNIRVYSQVTEAAQSPAVDPATGQPLTTGLFTLPQAEENDSTGQVSALQPGDIVFSLPDNSAFGYDETNLKVQDFTLSFELSRTPLQKLGSRFAFSREIDFPVTATLEVNAEVGDLDNANLANLLCENPNYDFNITLKKPNCNGTGDASLVYMFKQAKLVSQNFSSAIGSNATMSATYEVQIGGPQDTNRGVFISGTAF